MSIETRQLKLNNLNYNANKSLATQSTDTKQYSKIDLSHTHLTSFNAGKVIPIVLDECLPGDIYTYDIGGIIRMSTPASNTMQNPIISINFFFVSNESMWNEWKYFMGENKNAGYQKDYKQVPLLKNAKLKQGNYVQKLTIKENDLLAYIGASSVESDLNNKWDGEYSLNRLPITAYSKVWNDWYRDENLDSEINVEINDDNYNIDYDDIVDTDGRIKKDLDYHTLCKYGFGLAPASKLPDYFTTCLPKRQKGEAITINPMRLEDLIIKNTEKFNPENLVSPNWYSSGGTNLAGELGTWDAKSGYKGTQTGKLEFPNSSTKAYTSLEIAQKAGSEVNAFNINDLRMDIALQHLLELDNRFGTRYNEYLYSHWGININPLEIGKSEMIGGYEDTLKISNVIQTSKTEGSNPLGTIGGILQNYVKCPNKFTYAADQHGYIVGCVVVRTPITYCAGTDRKFTRYEKYDYFDPLLANIADQPVYNFEINDLDDTANFKERFGYNEAWANYRYTRNKATGFLSNNSKQSLFNLYAYGEKFSETPTLNINWMLYHKSAIQNTLFLADDNTSEFYNQFIANFEINCWAERKMPLYSTPGIKRI